MNRRTFIVSSALAAFTIKRGFASASEPLAVQRDFSLTGAHLRYQVPGLTQPAHILFFSDTHLWLTDGREDPFRQYSDRMAGAYNQTQHFSGKGSTHPQEAFETTLAYARDNAVELIILGGDIFSFPSEAAIDWAVARLEETGIPYVFTAGNHDWHYEGMPGSIAQLRATWSSKRLLPLYQGENPLMTFRDIRGIRFIILDNSTYEITAEQLDFFRTHTATGMPCFLAVHIPFYVPGRPVSFGCGHPEWGAATDRIHEIEKRERWPVHGHTPTTMAFHETVFNTSNLLGILAGHTHTSSIDVFREIPQVIAAPNATGAYIHLELV